MDAKNKTQKEYTLTFTLINPHAPLTPMRTLFNPKALKSLHQSYTSNSPHTFPAWKKIQDRLFLFLSFLSYKERIYSHLRTGFTQVQSSVLPSAVLLMPLMNRVWIETVLLGSLKTPLRWPNRTSDPIDPLDVRLFLFPALQGFFKHYLKNPTDQIAYLRQRHEQRLLGSRIIHPFRELMRYATYFAYKPSKKFLSPSTQPPNSPQLVENGILIPLALKSALSLIQNPEVSPLFGVRPGDQKRLENLNKQWKKSQNFFTRTLDVHSARSHIQQWATYFKIPQEVSDQSLSETRYDLTVFNQSTTKQGILNAEQGVLLNDPFLTESQLKRLLPLLSTFPAGLSSPWGLLKSNPFLFKAKLGQAQWISRRSLWLEALWLKGLTLQLKRHWSTKLIF